MLCMTLEENFAGVQGAGASARGNRGIGGAVRGRS